MALAGTVKKCSIGKPCVATMTKHEILERARAHIFSTGIGDGSSMLGRENMKFGLAKIHFVQENLGLEPNATFISTPDEGITRNIYRWEAGISYGGKLSWGSGKENFVILDAKPNACGMLVAGLDEVPKIDALLRELYEFEKKEHDVRGMPIKWDFNVGNHFIDVFEVKESISSKLPPYIAVIHAGCPELKGDNPNNPWNFGLYWHKSQKLMELAKTITTPFGACHILADEQAKKYFSFFRFAEHFSRTRRSLLYEGIFKEWGASKKQILTNVMHQGLLNMNEIVLGAQHITSEKTIFPISIRADMPSWLVHGKKNFTQEQIEMLGWSKRASTLGVTKSLKDANILPHGGGYMFQDTLKVEKVFEIGNKRFFELAMIGGMGKKIVSNMNDLEYAYRSTEVLTKIEEIGIAKFVAALNPLFTIKV